MPFHIGLDLGTTTVSGVLLDTEHGHVQRLAQRRNDSTLKTLPLRAEQDPHRLRALALDVLAELASDGVPLDGLALTGQMHGLLCVDAEGQPRTPLISWQDRRTAEPLPGARVEPVEAPTTLERLYARVADLDWQRNGCRLQHGYGAATLFWLVEQGELPPDTARVCTIADWLAGQLSSRLPVTDPTLAASWGVYDLLSEDWNTAFLDWLGLEARLLPPVHPSGERLGGLVPAVARQVGLPGGLPVFNALGDSQAAFLGSVADPQRALLLNLGTGGQVCWSVLKFEPPSERVETRPLPHGRLLRVGASLCGGEAYAWLNRTVRAWLAEFGLALDEETVYARLNTLAGKCEDTAGLRVRTTFLGVRGDPAMRGGAIEGITLDNLRLGALARATLRGIVDELYTLYREHGGEGLGHNRVVAAGGGVQKNPLLPGLIEARFGLPVQMPPQQETAATGAAVCVGLGIAAGV